MKFRFITINEIRYIGATMVFLLFVALVSLLAPREFAPAIALIILATTLVLGAIRPEEGKILRALRPVTKLLWLAMAVYGYIVAVVTLAFPAMLFAVVPYQVTTARNILYTSIGVSAFLGFIAALYREGEEMTESALAGAVIGMFIGLSSVIGGMYSGATTLEDLGRAVASMFGLVVPDFMLPFIGLYGLMILSLVSGLAAAMIGEYIY